MCRVHNKTALGRCSAPATEDEGICGLPGVTLHRVDKVPLCQGHASDPPGELPRPSRKRLALLCAMFVYAEEGSLECAAEAIVRSGEGWTLDEAKALLAAHRDVVITGGDRIRRALLSGMD